MSQITEGMYHSQLPCQVFIRLEMWIFFYKAI